MTNLTPQQRQELEKKIVLACGEERWNAENSCPECSNTIRLADVLIACLHYRIGVQVTMSGRLQLLPQCTRYKSGWQEDEEVQYDLTKPYHEQSEEFYSFLYSLLLP